MEEILTYIWIFDPQEQVADYKQEQLKERDPNKANNKSVVNKKDLQVCIWNKSWKKYEKLPKPNPI